MLALALDASNSEAATAAGLLTDVRRVSTIAKSTAADDVRGVALAALTDERALGGVARHAKIESTALAALGRLSTADELLATALNSEHREVALAAFDRVLGSDPTLVADVARLKSIEARAQDKVVARRARAMLQAIEDAENARRAAEEEREKQEAALCAAVERLATAMDPDRIAADLARLRAEWSTLASTDAAAARRFDRGADAAGLRIAQRRSEIAAALEEARRREEVLGGREALCRRVETLRDGDVLELEQLESMEGQWADLPPFVGFEREVEQLAGRFAASAKACRQRIAHEAALREARSALEALVAEAESLLTKETDDVADRWRALSREARQLADTLSEGSQPASDLLERLAFLSEAREARETAAREASAKAAADRVAKLAQLVSRARRTAESDTVTLREGERLLLDITTALENASKGETTRETEKTLADLRRLQDRIKNRVKELRDLDTWRRFANGEQQERLIAMAEAIVASLKAEEEAGTASDLAATANALRELQAEWKKVADGPQQSARELWDRFRLAVEFIRSRCEVYFAQIREQRSRNLATRVALVAQAEELADSTEWSKTAAQFQEMQKAWAECGPVSDASARGLALRFRAACNTFFTHRREALSSRKQEWNENLARKEALCERAQQLADSTDWDTTASELKKLQAEWKAIGPTRRDKSEEVWTRFRSAADKFFERYANRHKIAAAAQLAECEALVVALENLGASEDAPSDLAAQVQTLRTTISNLPQPEGAAATAVHERWMAALAALVSRWPAAFRGTDLDPVANRERKEKLLAKVEALVSDETPVAAANKTATELLAERLRSALESNALGVRPDETKWRAAGRAVEKAQDAWSRIAWLPGDDTGGLEERFRTACKRVMEQAKVYEGGANDDFAGGGAKGRPGRPKRPAGRG
ncbi:MAG TPA: DUF349 domain-containing protein [Candidatus Limnocylindrales bacterium]|nr:DUF349 domain-containing protein [Candidatus Limnocylindrales bacterium]